MKVCRQVTIPVGTDLSILYREKVGNYPKFFKMDTLSKLGFLLTEMLVEGETDRFVPREDRAVLVCSRNGCVCNDRHYEATVSDFPSPALFVYTLPNIVTGEIAIRNKYEGETSAYVLEDFDKERIRSLIEEAFQDRKTRSVVCCWIDCRSDEDYDAIGYLIEKQDIMELIEEIELKVIEALNLDGMTPEDIAPDAPLFGDEGLGLDSIDVLELIVLLEKNYGIRLSSPAEGKKVFQSMAVMADFVSKNRTR